MIKSPFLIVLPIPDISGIGSTIIGAIFSSLNSNINDGLSIKLNINRSTKITNPSDDLNNFYTGIGVFEGAFVNNMPHSTWYLVIAGGTGTTAAQIAFPLWNSSVPKQRHCAGGTWSSWEDLKAS